MRRLGRRCKAAAAVMCVTALLLSACGGSAESPAEGSSEKKLTDVSESREDRESGVQTASASQGSDGRISDEEETQGKRLSSYSGSNSKEEYPAPEVQDVLDIAEVDYTSGLTFPLYETYYPSRLIGSATIDEYTHSEIYLVGSSQDAEGQVPKADIVEELVHDGNVVFSTDVSTTSLYKDSRTFIPSEWVSGLGKKMFSAAEGKAISTAVDLLFHIIF